MPPSIASSPRSCRRPGTQPTPHPPYPCLPTPTQGFLSDLGLHHGVPRPAFFLGGVVLITLNQARRRRSLSLSLSSLDNAPPGGNTIPHNRTRLTRPTAAATRPPFPHRLQCALAFSGLTFLPACVVVTGLCFGSFATFAPVAATELFGEKAAGTVYGLIGSAPAVGSFVLNTLLAGRMYDREARLTPPAPAPPGAPAAPLELLEFGVGALAGETPGSRGEGIPVCRVRPSAASRPLFSADVCSVCPACCGTKREKAREQRRGYC